MGEDGRESGCGEQSIVMVLDCCGWTAISCVRGYIRLLCDARNQSKCYKDVPRKEQRRDTNSRMQKSTNKNGR